MEYIKAYFEQRIIPSLYFIVMWACISAGTILFTGDLWRGLGISSAFSLYNIVKIYYMKEFYGSTKVQSAEEYSE